MLEKTRVVFDAIKEIDGIEQFILIGGTALSIHCKHRLSEDLDFATTALKMDKDNVSQILSKLAEKFTVVSANAIGDIHEAINEGHDLYDHQQNYLVHDVKLTFFTYGENEHQRSILNDDTYVPDGKVKILSVDSLFKTKAIVITDRVKSRDIFDLWWMLGNLNYTFADIVETVSQYRPHVTYENLRYRLLDWPIANTDEGFDTLIDTKDTIETIRDELRKLVGGYELKLAADFFKDASDN